MSRRHPTLSRIIKFRPAVCALYSRSVCLAASRDFSQPRVNTSHSRERTSPFRLKIRSVYHSDEPGLKQILQVCGTRQNFDFKKWKIQREQVNRRYETFLVRMMDNKVRCFTWLLTSSLMKLSRDDTASRTVRLLCRRNKLSSFSLQPRNMKTPCGIE